MDVVMRVDAGENWVIKVAGVFIGNVHICFFRSIGNALSKVNHEDVRSLIFKTTQKVFGFKVDIEKIFFMKYFDSINNLQSYQEGGSERKLPCTNSQQLSQVRSIYFHHKIVVLVLIPIFIYLGETYFIFKVSLVVLENALQNCDLIGDLRMFYFLIFLQQSCIVQTLSPEIGLNFPSQKIWSKPWNQSLIQARNEFYTSYGQHLNTASLFFSVFPLSFSQQFYLKKKQKIYLVEINIYYYIDTDMNRLITIIKRGLKNPKIAHSKKEFRTDTHKDLYPIVGFTHVKLGAMQLNKPDNNNNLNEEATDEWYRYLCTYQHDHTVENVWIEHRGAFCGGIDYEELLTSELYLDKLYRMGVLLAKFNKPVLAKVNGGVRGTAAYVLSMLSTPLGTGKATLTFDDTARGFIPLLGGSHKLSHLPAQIGLYLALTGETLDVDEMIRLNFLRGRISDGPLNHEIRQHLSDANLFMQRPYDENTFCISEAQRVSEVAKKKHNLKRDLEISQLQLFSSRRNFYTKLALNQYNLAKIEYENAKTPFNSFSEKQGLLINNYFEMRHNRPFNYLRDKGFLEIGTSKQFYLARFPMEKIIAIFSSGSLTQIIQGLENDGGEWAQATLAKMRKKDPLALHLTFHMIREAKQMDWASCLQMEYGIAKRLLKNSKVEISESKKGSKKIFVNPYSDYSIEKITQSILEPFLSKQYTPDETFEENAPKYSLLPNSQYWSEVPDSVRHFLNETFFDDIHFKNQKGQVLRFLNFNKVDYRDNSYSLEKLREYVYKNYNSNREIQGQRERLRIILRKQNFLDELLQRRKVLIQNQMGDQNLKEKINSIIKEYFENKFQNRFKDLQKTTKLAGKEEKMEIFRKYREVMFENIIMNGSKIQQENIEKNLVHSGLVYFDNEGKNIFDGKNPHQENMEALQDLKKEIDSQELGKMALSEEYREKYRDVPKPENLGIKNQQTRLQKFKRGLDELILKRYDQPLALTQKIKFYRKMIEKASKTSEQVAALLQWSDDDIESLLVNAPRQEVTFLDYAQSIVNLNNQNTEYKTKFVNEFIKKIENRVNEYEIVNEQSNQAKRPKTPFLFDMTLIPPPFRVTYYRLLDQIIDFFNEKYKIQDFPQANQEKMSIFDEWVQNSLAKDYTEFLKYDVQYMFSYIAMLQIKQMLFNIQQKGGLIQLGDLSQFFQENYHLHFEHYSKAQIERQIMGFLYRLLDLHADSKDRIIMPETKLLDFLNRKKISNENSVGKSILSFDSILLLIAKDRKRLRNQEKGIDPILGVDPEQAMSLLESEQQFEKTTTFATKFKDLKEGQLKVEVEKYVDTLKSHIPQEEKKLVMGYIYYLHRFQEIIQKASGDDLFLPEEFRKRTQLIELSFLKNLLRIDISDKAWYENTLREVIYDILSYREEREKDLSQGSLVLFDREFCQIFEPDVLSSLLNYKLTEELLLAKRFSASSREIERQQKPLSEKEIYLEMKKSIKNFKALRLLNNLFLSEKICSKRRQQALIPSEQFDDLKSFKQIKSQTVKRLTSDLYTYPEEDEQWDENYKRRILGKSDNEPESLFLDQIKQLVQFLHKDEQKLKNTLERQMNILEGKLK